MVYTPHADLIQAAREDGALVVAVFHDDGEKITVTWPDGRGDCVTSPAVIEDFVAQINQLRRDLRAAHSGGGVTVGAAPAGR